MLRYFSIWCTAIEHTPLTLARWIAAFVAIVVVRIAIENFFKAFSFHFPDYYFYYFTDFLFSFAFTILLITPIIQWAGRISFQSAANLSLFVFLISWLPPIIDTFMSRGAGLLSFYSFDSLFGLGERYLTFFGHDPTVGITYGVRTEIALVTLGVIAYAYSKTKSWWRPLIAGWGLYTALFVIAALPSFVVIGLLGWSQGFLTVGETDIAAFMLKPEFLFGIPQPELASVLNLKVTLLFIPLLTLLVIGIAWHSFRSIWQALLRNARFPQIIYHQGLFSIGAGLVFLYGKPAFELNFFHALGLFACSLAITFAWLASVVVNDYYDIAVDTITNADRPLITGTIDRSTYLTLGTLFFLASLLLMAIISTQAMLLLLAYQSIAYLYSAPPLRLKRFPFLATFLAASASMLIIFAGFITFSADKNIALFPGSVALLLFLAYTILLPIKDFKDITGDRADSILTIPILLGEERAKRLLGSLAFLLFMVSVFVLGVRPLFPLALFFGSLAFWLLQISTPDHRYVSYRRLHGWYIALVSGYVFFLVLHFIA